MYYGLSRPYRQNAAFVFAKIFDSNAGIGTTVPFGTPSFATASGCGVHSGLVSVCGSFVLSAFSDLARAAQGTRF